VSNYVRWEDIRAAEVERAGGEAVVEAGKQELLAEVIGHRLAEIRRSRGLTQQQIANLRLAARNFLTQMQELMAPRPGVPPEQARAAMQQQAEQTRPMINRELTPQQIARLQQILLQIEGPCMAVREPEMLRQLGLTPAEQGQAGVACRERGAQMRAAFHPPAPGEEPCQAASENRIRIERIRSDTDRKVLALFSPAERSKFAAMQGRHIDLEPPMPPGCRPAGSAG